MSTLFPRLTLAESRSKLRPGGHFEVVEKKTTLQIMRKRWLPNGGISRLLIPRCVAKLKARPDGVKLSLRPDTLALFMGIMLTGGLAVEIMDRHPRQYPPWFVPALLGLYLVSIAYDSIRLRRMLIRALRV